MSSSHCGIDFGTTNSSLAISSSNTPKVIPIDRQNTNPSILRSLIYINPSQQTNIGFDAITHYLNDLKELPSKPLRVVNTGRMIKVMTPTGSGVMKADWVPEIIEVDDSGRGRLLQSLKSVLTSSVFTGTNIFGQFYTLEELLTILLKEIKTRAEKEIDHELTSAVIGRPVKYVGTSENKIALDRMRTIATNSGFKHIEFEYEPVGAALHYSSQNPTPQNILVFDFGGGTLDICIMKLPEQKIIAVSGRGIGGDLLDSQIVKSYFLHHFGSKAIINGRLSFPRHFFSAFDSWYQTTLQKNVKNIDSLRKMAIESDNPASIENLINLIIHDYGFEFFQSVDQAKINLSTLDTVDFSFNRPHLNLKQTLSKTNFEQAIVNELEETKICIKESLHQAQLKPNDIDKVILTGGSSQVPVFIKLISEIFGPEKLITSDHFTSVASGLALRAEQLF
jgi:hypothetical chaperone protein